MSPERLEATTVLPCVLCGELLSDTYAASTTVLHYAIDASVVAEIALEQQKQRTARLSQELEQHYFAAHMARRQWVPPI